MTFFERVKKKWMSAAVMIIFIIYQWSLVYKMSQNTRQNLPELKMISIIHLFCQTNSPEPESII